MSKYEQRIENLEHNVEVLIKVCEKQNETLEIMAKHLKIQDERIEIEQTRKTAGIATEIASVKNLCSSAIGMVRKINLRKEVV